MTYTDQLALLDAIENFSVPIIPPTTHFWMIRTKKGYFYNEFLSKRFVALAWNNISQETDFSESNKDSLKDDILMTFKKFIALQPLLINVILLFTKSKLMIFS